VVRVARSVLRDRDGDGLPGVVFETESAFFQDHTQILKDDMLRSVLVHPLVTSAHLKSDGELLDFRKSIAPAPVARCSIRHELVKVSPVIMGDRKLFTEGIPVHYGMQSLLMEPFHVDVCADVVSLSFSKWQPRR
jgi:hypothetical protein